MSTTARKWGIFALVAAFCLAIPSESQAFFFNWWRGNSCCGNTSYYAPRVSFFRPVRSYYGNCCPQTSCCYTPQTCCYRTQVCNVPVTTYYRVRSCDPCTGCAVTYLRPSVSYVRQVNYAPTTCCPTTSYYSPSVTYSSGVSSDCCTPTITSQPTLSGGTTSGGTTTGGSSEAPSTFKGSSTQDSLKPIPRVEENGSSSLDKPEKQDRTALAPPRQSWTFRRAVATADEVQPRVIPAAHAEPAQPRRLSESGWRASR